MGIMDIFFVSDGVSENIEAEKKTGLISRSEFSASLLSPKPLKSLRTHNGLQSTIANIQTKILK